MTEESIGMGNFRKAKDTKIEEKLNEITLSFTPKQNKLFKFHRFEKLIFFLLDEPRSSTNLNNTLYIPL